jgi:hypothetical protein
MLRIPTASRGYRVKQVLERRLNIGQPPAKKQNRAVSLV